MDITCVRTTATETCTASRFSKRAFTLVELIVVVAIIGILVFLLLPAVQSAREAARRMSCSNNLVQLVMAVHQYEATHRVYPPGTVNATSPILNQLKGYHHGWIEQMLPFLEKEAVYHHIDRDVSVYHKNNMPARRLQVGWLMCPSNSQNGSSYSHYAALHHDVEASIDADQNGVFFLNSAVTQDAVSDGVGYTIFLGEKVSERGDLGWMSGTRAILRNTGERINTAKNQRNTGRRWPRPVPQYPPGVFTDTSMGGGMGAGEAVYEDGDVSGGGIAGGGQITDWSLELAGTTPRAVATFVGGFASYHRSGSNFAMGDGSVRLLAETISMPVYRQLGNRADGKLVNLE